MKNRFYTLFFTLCAILVFQNCGNSSGQIHGSSTGSIPAPPDFESHQYASPGNGGAFEGKVYGVKSDNDCGGEETPYKHLHLVYSRNQIIEYWRDCKKVIPVDVSSDVIITSFNSYFYLNDKFLPLDLNQRLDSDTDDEMAVTSFKFDDLTGAEIDKSFFENQVVSGFLEVVEAKVDIGPALLRKNNIGEWRSTVSLESGDTLNVQMTSSASYSSTISTAITLGSTVVDWNITTMDDPHGSLDVLLVCLAPKNNTECAVSFKVEDYIDKDIENFTVTFSVGNTSDEKGLEIQQGIRTSVSNVELDHNFINTTEISKGEDLTPSRTRHGKKKYFYSRLHYNSASGVIDITGDASGWGDCSGNFCSGRVSDISISW